MMHSKPATASIPRFILSAMVLIAVTIVIATASMRPSDAREGWESIFNGSDFDGWRVSEAAAESWSVVDGVIDCDPRSTQAGDRNIWTEQSYGDFILYAEWRLTDAPTVETRPLIGPDGRTLTDEDGEEMTATFPNADSGIFLRGMPKAQVNIWNWPVGSGEVWGYRTDESVSDEVRAGVTPRTRADREIGEWNTFVITMIGDRLSVVLNGEIVINHARLPGVEPEGPIALQYHGGFDHESGEYGPASSLVQFRNLHIKPLGPVD